MTIDLTTIIEAIIMLLASIITYKVIPWLKAKTTTEQQAALRIATRTCVFAAEQVFGSGFGAEKLAYVKQHLAMRGYDVDLDAIEAAVREMSLEAVADPVNPE